MAHVDIVARQHLGLAYNPDPTSVRAAVLRAANVVAPTFSVPTRVDDWFVSLANEMAGLVVDGDAPIPATAIREVVDNLIGALHAYLAPTVLALTAPNHNIQECAAGFILTRCKSEVRMLLPGFYASVIAQWKDGSLRHEGGPDV